MFVTFQGLQSIWEIFGAKIKCCALCCHRRRYKFQVFEVVVWHYVVVEDVIEKLVLLKVDCLCDFPYLLVGIW